MSYEIDSFESDYEFLSVLLGFNKGFHIFFLNEKRKNEEEKAQETL